MAYLAFDDSPELSRETLTPSEACQLYGRAPHEYLGAVAGNFASQGGFEQYDDLKIPPGDACDLRQLPVTARTASTHAYAAEPPRRFELGPAGVGPALQVDLERDSSELLLQ
ncbi:hypothetical protein PHYPSEUDO_008662 [Phytophthora pseudosyringae]|uniref:Uncharacterized protein n=1 Tax=Phytophthora pseudosyringae TaxID=221518 RepID=A0A8T1VJ21_9STRA|nr:hypothetical protein PHYPSEUDO_008662 [Phytophthora pseudosyringae]